MLQKLAGMGQNQWEGIIQQSYDLSEEESFSLFTSCNTSVFSTVSVTSLKHVSWISGYIFFYQDTAEEKSTSVSTSEPFCRQKIHRKVLDKGVPDDAMPGILNIKVSKLLFFTHFPTPLFVSILKKKKNCSEWNLVTYLKLLSFPPTKWK